MFFLLRAAFWIGLILVLVPSGSNDPSPPNQFGAGEAISAAATAIADASRFCSRQPDACAVGSQAASAVGQRAQAGAKRLYGIVTEQQRGEAVAAPGSAVAPAAPKAESAPLISSQNSLTAADRSIPYRSPQPRPEVVARRPS
jgi:hypothetical protein